MKNQPFGIHDYTRSGFPKTPSSVRPTVTDRSQINFLREKINDWIPYKQHSIVLDVNSWSFFFGSWVLTVYISLVKKTLSETVGYVWEKHVYCRKTPCRKLTVKIECWVKTRLGLGSGVGSDTKWVLGENGLGSRPPSPETVSYRGQKCGFRRHHLILADLHPASPNRGEEFTVFFSKLFVHIFLYARNVFLKQYSPKFFSAHPKALTRPNEKSCILQGENTLQKFLHFFFFTYWCYLMMYSLSLSQTDTSIHPKVWNLEHRIGKYQSFLVWFQEIFFGGRSAFPKRGQYFIWFYPHEISNCWIRQFLRTRTTTCLYQ